MIIAIVLIVGAFVVLVDLTIPAYQDAEKVKSDELSRQAFLDRQKKAIDQVKSLLGTYEGQVDAQEKVSLALPQNQDLAGILAQLNGLAQASGLVPQVFSASVTEVQNPSDASQKGQKALTDTLVRPVGTIALQTKFIGPYDNLKSFLQKLETNIRIFDVRSLNVQPVSKSSQDLYSYDVAVVTYYQNP